MLENAMTGVILIPVIKSCLVAELLVVEVCLEILIIVEVYSVRRRVTKEKFFF